MFALFSKNCDYRRDEPRVHIDVRPDTSVKSLWVHIGDIALAFSLEEAALLRDRITAVLAAQTQAPAEVRS